MIESMVSSISPSIPHLLESSQMWTGGGARSISAKAQCTPVSIRFIQYKINFRLRTYSILTNPLAIKKANDNGKKLGGSRNICNGWVCQTTPVYSQYNQGLGSWKQTTQQKGMCNMDMQQNIQRTLLYINQRKYNKGKHTSLRYSTRQWQTQHRRYFLKRS